jgi:hypothetical protein
MLEPGNAHRVFRRVDPAFRITVTPAGRLLDDVVDIVAGLWLLRRLFQFFQRLRLVEIGEGVAR